MPNRAKSKRREGTQQTGVETPSLRRRWAAAAVLVVLVSLVFGRVVFHPFCSWDDPIHVTENPYLDPPSLEHLRELFLHPYRKLYNPMTYVFFSGEKLISDAVADTENGQPHPAVFHAGSLLLHVLCALMVYVILLNLVGQVWPSLAGAMLFALHPLVVESVAWISETRGLLAGFFSLVALWLYLRFARSGPRSADAAIPTAPQRSTALRMVYYVLATLAFVLALLSKASAVSLPLIAALIDLGFVRRRAIDVAKSQLLWLALALAVAIVSKGQQGASELKYVTPLWSRPFVALDAMAFYMFKAVLPFELGVHYERDPRTVLNHGWAYLTFLIPTVVAIVLWYTRRNREWLISAGIFAAALLPTLGLVPFVFQNFSTVADRYAYMAIFGLSVALAAWLARQPDNRRARTTRSHLRDGAVALVLIAFGILSVIQVSHWSNDRRLYEHALAVNPHSALAQNHLGVILGTANERDQALGHLEEAVKLDPRYADAQYNLGNALARVRRTREAQEHYAAALRLDPHYYQAHYNLAGLLYQRGALDKAIAHYRAALKIKPDHAAAHQYLASALAAQGKLVEAIAHYREALKLRPAYRSARLNLAWILATSPDPAMRKPAEAIALIQGAESPTLTQRPAALDTLAAAYASAGRYSDAIRTATTARNEAKALGQKGRLGEIERRLKLYQAHQPYVSPLPPNRQKST